MDEYDYIGFFEGEKYVCAHHFEDRYLNQYIPFLKSFHDDITKSLGQNAREAIDYVPSQVFTEFLRWMFKDKEGKKIKGLVYRSSKTGLSNVVLFCDNAESRTWLKLKSFSVSVWDRSVD